MHPHKKIDLNTYCGTIDFIAPEVFDEKTNYNEKCDIWSIGVIAFFLMSGTPPFMGKDDVEVRKNITTCNYDFNYDLWDKFSDHCIPCIESLLELNPEKRFDVDQALAHPWLMKAQEIRPKLHPSVLLNLHGCNTPHRLHYELLTLFTMYLNDKDIKSIRETFMFMDKDNGGDISTEELRDAYKLLNEKNWQDTELFTISGSSRSTREIRDKQKIYEPVSDEKIDEILIKVDQDGNGQIEYSEFLTHALTGK